MSNTDSNTPATTKVTPGALKATPATLPAAQATIITITATTTASPATTAKPASNCSHTNCDSGRTIRSSSNPSYNDSGYGCMYSYDSYSHSGIWHTVTRVAATADPATMTVAARTAMTTAIKATTAANSFTK